MAYGSLGKKYIQTQNWHWNGGKTCKRSIKSTAKSEEDKVCHQTNGR